MFDYVVRRNLTGTADDGHAQISSTAPQVKCAEPDGAVCRLTISRREAEMAARIFFSIAALPMAVGAFCGGGPTTGGLADPFGIVFLLVAMLIWFAWGAIQEGFSSGPMDLMFVRAALFLKNKARQKNPDR
jgi:hypothetical protein